MSSMTRALQSDPFISTDNAACHPACHPYLTSPFTHGLSESDKAGLGLITRRRRIRQGDCIYRMNDVFENLYIVQSGSIKATILNVAGLEQVTSFHLAGEIFGLDGIVDKRCGTTTIAMEDGEIDEIPFDRFEMLCVSSRSLHRRILQAASEQIVSGGASMLVGTVKAEQRFAGFLYSFSVRYALLGHSATHFRLPMTRYDIGSYLYLTSECISRLIAKLKNSGLIELDGREVRLLDVEALKAIADGATAAMPRERKR